MPDVLLFRLYAPLASFGTVAVGEQRPSQTHPGKSMVVGLLAAALGIRRDEEARLSQLTAGLGLAVLQLSSGDLLRDYHTAQAPSQSDLNKAPHYSRRDELRAAPKQDLNTILSSRDYRSEAVNVVAVWRRSGCDEAVPHLPELVRALEQPRFALCIGRKSCPLSLPLAPRVVEATDIRSAFEAELANFESIWQVASWDRRSDSRTISQRLGIGGFPGPTPTRMFWEDSDSDDLPSGFGPQQTRQTHTRYDAALSRKRWQFGARLEHVAAWPQLEASK
ncbi:MAG: type I-E CRISPR-associated protein Cas5/CasD [Panacagrimonas sp.]